MAPEYVMHGNLSTKADVYSFGVVVLELISGHKNYTFNLDPECHNLLDWVRTLPICSSTLIHLDHKNKNPQ